MTKIKRIKESWPTKDAMIQIYELNLWGGNKNEFHSGEGSHAAEIVDPYIAVVKNFLTTFQHPLNVCDLGCGDFNVGSKLVEFTEKYIAIDIVPDLIAHNREKFKADHLTFLCLDLVKDDFPTGNCALLRQVLQHLSNSEVKVILNKLKQFKYLILSEHIPVGDFTPNIDIISGQGIRLKKQSGLMITKPPFDFKFKNETVLFTYFLQDGKSKIVTTLFEI